MKTIISSYINELEKVLKNDSWNDAVEKLGHSIKKAWVDKSTVYICGNGGSAANAMHMANDFIYGIGKNTGLGLNVEALPSNTSVITCLANDIGYENIYSYQLKTKAKKDDVLIVLSGSGNSPNVINALEAGNKIGMKTFAILGFEGGRCKEIAQHPIHFNVDDMQISEDLQLIVGHICMQWLCQQGIS